MGKSVLFVMYNSIQLTAFSMANVMFGFYFLSLSKPSFLSVSLLKHSIQCFLFPLSSNQPDARAF